MKGWYWTPAQRRALEVALSRTHRAAVFRRLWALLEIGQGTALPEVAQKLRVDRRTLYRWAQRFALDPTPGALEDQPGRGRPRCWSRELADLLESAMAHRPLELGYPANHWSAPLLQALLAVWLPEQEVSPYIVRERLRELGYVWKRFRYELVPDPEVEKKTPTATSDPGAAVRNRPVGRGRNGLAALSTPACRLGAARSARKSAHFRAERPPDRLCHLASAHWTLPVPGSAA